MPYLEVQKKENTEEREKVKIPDVRGKTLKEAQKVLKELDIKVEIEPEKEELSAEDIIIIEQLPKPGIEVFSGSKVTLYR